MEDMSDLHVSDGCSGTLQCRLQASSDTDITWYRNDKLIKASRDFKPSFDGYVATLEITEVFPEDAGVYVCKAHNVHGEASSSATVSVIGECCIYNFWPSISDWLAHADLSPEFRASSSDIRSAGHCCLTLL